MVSSNFIKHKRKGIIMNKEDFSTCMKLHRELKAKIRGRIFIEIKDGTLTVYIHDRCGVKFKRTVNITSSKVNIEVMTSKIVNDYRGYIINKFFYTGTSKIVPRG